MDKWTLKALLWDPTLDSRFDAKRRQGRPLTRWTDDITAHYRRYNDQCRIDNNNTTRRHNDTTDSTTHSHDEDQHDDDDAHDEDDEDNNTTDNRHLIEAATNIVLWEELEESYVRSRRPTKRPPARH